MENDHFLTIHSTGPGDSPYSIFVPEGSENNIQDVENWFLFTMAKQPVYQVINMLDYQFGKYKERHPDKEETFLYSLQYCIRQSIELKTEEEGLPIIFRPLPADLKDIVNEWIDKKKKELETPTQVKVNDKIKWKGTPSQLGYLFIELVRNGFIEPPLYNGEPNFSGLARLCFQFFETGTTPGNLTKEMNPEKNTLSDPKRAKFTIPNLSDLA